MLWYPINTNSPEQEPELFPQNGKWVHWAGQTGINSSTPPTTEPGHVNPPKHSQNIPVQKKSQSQQCLKVFRALGVTLN